MLKVGDTKYEVRGTKYEVRGTRYEVKRQKAENKFLNKLGTWNLKPQLNTYPNKHTRKLKHPHTYTPKNFNTPHTNTSTLIVTFIET